MFRCARSCLWAADGSAERWAAARAAWVVAMGAWGAIEYLLFYQGAENHCAPSTTINSSGAWAALSVDEARLHYDSIERRHSEEPFLAQAGDLVRGPGDALITANNRGATTAVAVHAIDAITWRKLTLTPGLRFELMRMRALDRQLGTPSKSSRPRRAGTTRRAPASATGGCGPRRSGFSTTIAT